MKKTFSEQVEEDRQEFVAAQKMQKANPSMSLGDAIAAVWLGLPGVPPVRRRSRQSRQHWDEPAP